MKLTFLVVGKTSESYLKEGIDLYTRRLKRYVSFELKEINTGSSTSNPEKQKETESKALLRHPDFLEADSIVLLDERGTLYTSIEFAGFIQKQLNRGYKKIVFVIGGAYGFAPALYEQADYTLSLSKQTFSHQMVRLFFTEQLYRAFTIIKGEKYHH